MWLITDFNFRVWAMRTISVVMGCHDSSRMVKNRTFLRFNHVSSRAHGLRSHIHSSDLLIYCPISHKMFDRWLYHLNVLVVVKRNCHFRVKFQYKSKFSIIIWGFFCSKGQQNEESPLVFFLCKDVCRQFV